jgi:Secretion system C-terminal sorting domain
MRWIAMVVLFVGLVSVGSADVIFEEYFTDGSILPGWFSPWPGGADITITPDMTTPGGDGWVGSVAGDQSSTALNGSIELADYTVDSWVYTIVSDDMMFPVYNGIAARWDTTGGNSYYYMASMFGLSKKIRLRRFPGSGFGAETFLEWTGDDIPGGEPTESGWHKMTMQVSGDEINCWWDEVLLPGCPYTPAVEFRQTSGFYGIYEFYMGDQVPEPETVFDSFVVSDENTSVREISIVPMPNASTISSLYPNPFNAMTTIEFKNANAGEVKLAVYDILGREMTTLQQGFMPPGNYQVTWNAQGYSAGNYFIRLELDGQQYVHRAVLAK